MTTLEDEVLLSGMSIEAKQAIETQAHDETVKAPRLQVAKLLGDPNELWRKVQAVLGHELGSDLQLRPRSQQHYAILACSEASDQGRPG